MRAIVLCLSVVLLIEAGCDGSDDTVAPHPTWLAPAPDSGMKPESGSYGLKPALDGGYCCPVQYAASCDCVYVGGWTTKNDPYFCPKVCDMAGPWGTDTDEHGCTVFGGSGSCLNPNPDAGGVDVTPIPSDSASD
jgi:hypothetical protein